jgi:hypothetical protein
MSLYTDIQSCQNNWQFPLVRKRILVRTPINLVVTHNPLLRDLWLFDPTPYVGGDTSDYVYLVILPDYTPSNNFPTERGYKTTFSQRTANFSTRERVFEATVKQSQAFIYYIINQLIAISESSSTTQHHPIRVIDTCLPDGLGGSPVQGSGTVTIQGQDKGTIRYGRIDITKEPQGLVTENGMDYCIGGWSFKFTELGLRY